MNVRFYCELYTEIRDLYRKGAKGYSYKKIWNKRKGKKRDPYRKNAKFSKIDEKKETQKLCKKEISKQKRKEYPTLL